MAQTKKAKTAMQRLCKDAPVPSLPSSPTRCRYSASIKFEQTPKEADHDHVGGQRKIQRPGVLLPVASLPPRKPNARDQPQQGQAR